MLAAAFTGAVMGVVGLGLASLWRWLGRWNQRRGQRVLDARGQQTPYDASWGTHYAVIEDPHGNAVGPMSPTDAAYRAAPPSQSPAAPGPVPPIGAQVLDSRGQKFAHVAEVSGEFFKLRIPMAADFWLPTAYVASVDGEHVHLSINRDDVDQYKLASPNKDDVINDL